MRKKNVPSTPKEWFDYALFYCSKRETSRPKLQSYLKRKIKTFSKTFNLGEHPKNRGSLRDQDKLSTRLGRTLIVLKNKLALGNIKRVAGL